MFAKRAVKVARRRWFPLGAALFSSAAVLLLAAACGGSDGGGDAAGGNGGNGGANGFAAYTECLRQQGINVPTDRPTGRPSGRPSGTPSPGASQGSRGGGFGSFRPEGVDDATWQKAQDACRAKLPSGRPSGFPSGFPSGGPNSGAFTAYRNCLRDNGVTDGSMRDLNTADPKVAAAVKKCEVLRPTGDPGGGPGGGAAPTP